MEMMDTISSKWIFLIIESHKNNIESIDEIDSENRGNRSDFSSGYDGECRDHKCRKHRARLSEENLRANIVEPTDKNRGDKYRETKEDENRIALRRRRRVYEIEFDSKNGHHEKRDERKTRSEARNSI